MIAARLSRKDDGGGICVMLVLEPGNIEKMKAGQPVHKFLNEFMPELQTQVELLLLYSPDTEWVARQVKDDPSNLDKLVDAIEASRSRPEIVVRGETAEEMKRMI